MFFIDDQKIPDTLTTMDSIFWNEEYLEPRIEGYLLIVLNLPMCS